MNKLIKFLKLESIFGSDEPKNGQQSIDTELEEQFFDSFQNLKEDDIPPDSNDMLKIKESKDFADNQWN